MSVGGPPPVTRWLLGRILAAEDREHALGDLEEEFRQVATERGRAAARRWYRSQLRGAVGPSLSRRGHKVARWMGRRAVGLAAVLRPSVVGPALRQVRRTLGRRPRLVAASAVTLSLGVGFATAIFSVVYEVVLRPLPYPEGDRMVQIWNTYDSWRGHEVLDPLWDRVPLSWPEFVDLEREGAPLEAAALYADLTMPITGLGDPREATVGIATASLFELLGVEPLLGRTFSPDEQGPDAPRVAVLTHDTWVGALGGDADVIGGTLTLAGEPFTILGVLPPGFGLRSIRRPIVPARVAWVPVGAMSLELDRGNHSYEAIGRLVRGVDLLTATSVTGRILANGAPREERGARLTPRRAEESAPSRAPLLLLLGGVGLLLIIACGNFATLLIGEAVRRRPELATRYALGAERGQILSQLALESTALGVLGGLAAFPVTVLATRGLLALAPDDMLLPASIAPDLRILLGGLALGAVGGAVFGVAPAAAIRRDRLRSHLRSGGRGWSSERRAVRHGVLVLQLALSSVLLVSGGLLVRGWSSLRGAEVGFEAEALWRARVLVTARSMNPDEARAAYHGIAEMLGAVPGIEGVSLVSAFPFSGRGGSSSFQIVGREASGAEKSPEAVRRTVLPGYHELLGIPLVEGRSLTGADRVFDAPVVVVSRALAERYWPAGGAVGARVRRDGREWEVVGVVADVRHGSLREAYRPTMYVPYDVAEVPYDMSVIVQSGLAPEALARAIHDAVAVVAPGAPVEDLRSARSLLDQSTQEERFRAALLTALAALATLLCAIGVFASTERVVAARERELGIRLALGARRPRLIGAVLRQEGAWMMTGLLLGALGGVVAGTVLGRVVEGVDSFDALTLATSTGVLLVAAGGAVAHAARRGTRLDPVGAMRAE